MEGTKRKFGAKTCQKCGTEANSNAQPKCKNCGTAFEKKGKYKKRSDMVQHPKGNAELLSPSTGEASLKRQIDEHIKVEKIIIAAGLLSQEKFDTARELVRQ